MHRNLKIIIERPKNIVSIQEKIPNICVDLAYLKDDNFSACIVDGYIKNIAYLELKATNALTNVQESLRSKNLGLKIFDSYRPLRAIKFFKSWSVDCSLPENKSLFPTLTRKSLFEDGYIDPQSSHSRASTIDLTIIDIDTKVEIDMGTMFDFF